MTVTSMGTVGHSTVRSEELHRLLRAVEAARAGSSMAIELAGDPGAGKTRLLTAVVHRAVEKGLTVLRGRCAEAERGVPFHPFIQALTTWRAKDGSGAEVPQATALITALAAGPPSEDATDFTRRCHFYAELRRLLADCLAHATGGMLIALDDCHWADPCSAELLDMLVRWPVEGGLALVVAHRPRQAPVELRVALRHGIEQGAIQAIELPALSLEQSAELLHTTPDDPALARLQEQSCGNPLYLAALASARRSDDRLDIWTRGGFGARLLAETTLLDDMARTVANAAAVLGDPFDVDSVAEVAGIDRDEACSVLGRLRQRDLIRPAAGPGLLSFRHPLLRSCLYTAADACWRTGAHRRALSRLSALGVPAIELAPHIARSGSTTEASDLRVLGTATRTALHLGKPADAARWLTVALRVRRTARPSPEGEAIGLELWRSVVLALTAHGDAEGVLALARDIPAGPNGEIPRLAAVTLLSGVLAALGRDEEAQAFIGAELGSDTAMDRDATALLHVQQQVVKVLSGQVPARADAEALVRQTAGAAPGTVAGALVLRGLCAVLAGDTCSAERALNAGAQALDELDDGRPAGDQESVHLLVLSWSEALMGWYERACDHGERALSAVRERGDAHLLPPLLDTLAYAHYQAGHMADALHAAQEGRVLAKAAGRADHVGLSDAITAAAWAQLGRTATCTARRPPTGEPLAASRTPLNALLMAESYLTAGDGPSAMALLLPRKEAWRVSEPVAVLAARGYELLAAAAVQSGMDADSIQEWADHATEAATAVGLAEQQGHAMLAHGHALMSQGLTKEAAQRYREAFELFGGNSPSAARAKELARAADRSTGTRPEQLLAELTLREREVAELAGEGRKSREIAEKLRVSPRTVDAHLTRIYTKLGVNSRAELARIVALSG
ncbi:ATP-binding protein [Streptomyces regalis]|uniref:HTH luxR-type domain-containing protein n=1 Tax=Streptomyces regalis TaxID=68262 RepID=A0A101JBC9_9ACTN|nr:LuxR family transcriptional regulator [Streptomyces regalis]KUL23657.1 hypothetical protein ADL12_39125 [Streptomyces regalis]